MGYWNLLRGAEKLGYEVLAKTAKKGAGKASERMGYTLKLNNTGNVQTFAANGKQMENVSTWSWNSTENFAHTNPIGDTFTRGRGKCGGKEGITQEAGTRIKRGKTNSEKHVQERKPKAEIKPEESAEAIAQRQAKEAYDKEFARLIEIESQKGGINRLPSKEVLENELTKREFDILKPYLDRYRSAKVRLVGAPGKKFMGSQISPMVNDIKARKYQVEHFYESISNDFARLKPQQAEKMMQQRIRREVNGILPERFTDFRAFKELESKFGKELFEVTEKAPQNIVGKSVYVRRTPQGKVRYITVNREAVAAKRESMINEYTENARKYMDIQAQMQGLSRGVNPSHFRLPKDVTKELDALEVLELALKKGITKYPQKLGNGITIRNSNDLRILKLKLEAEREFANNYVKKSGQLRAAQQAIVRSDVRVDSAYKRVKDRLANDRGVNKALEKIEMLNGKYATEEEKALYAKIKGLTGSGSSKAEIEARVRESMKGSTFERQLGVTKKMFQPIEELTPKEIDREIEYLVEQLEKTGSNGSKKLNLQYRERLFDLRKAQITANSEIITDVAINRFVEQNRNLLPKDLSARIAGIAKLPEKERIDAAVKMFAQEIKIPAENIKVIHKPYNPNSSFEAAFCPEKGIIETNFSPTMSATEQIAILRHEMDHMQVFAQMYKEMGSEAFINMLKSKHLSINEKVLTSNYNKLTKNIDTQNFNLDKYVKAYSEYNSEIQLSSRQYIGNPIESRAYRLQAQYDSGLISKYHCIMARLYSRENELFDQITKLSGKNFNESSLAILMRKNIIEKMENPTSELITAEYTKSAIGIMEKIVHNLKKGISVAETIKRLQA